MLMISAILASGLLLDMPAAAGPSTSGGAACARRSFLAAATSVGLHVFVAAPPASAAGGFEDFVAQQRQQQLIDPFAAVREQNPERSRSFVDELPPMDATERRAKQRAAAEQIFSGENKARPEALVSPTAQAPAPVGASGANLQDEITLEFDATKPLGLKLKDLRVGFETGMTEGTSRVLVQDVLQGGQAAVSGQVSIDNIVVAVDGVNVERDSAKDVQAKLARAKASGQSIIRVTFKDPLAFNERLNAPSMSASATKEAAEPISTKVAPATSNQAEQILSIRRIEIPEMSYALRRQSLPIFRAHAPIRAQANASCSQVYAQRPAWRPRRDTLRRPAR